jgi:arsenate reductase
MAESVLIFHNPRCSKSRQTLALIESRGIEPVVVRYLDEPPDEDTLRGLLGKLGISAGELVRAKEHAALGLSATDDIDELLRRMAANPQIIERPIVVRGERAVLGRPPENVLALL